MALGHNRSIHDAACGDMSKPPHHGRGVFTSGEKMASGAQKASAIPRCRKTEVCLEKRLAPYEEEENHKRPVLVVD